MGRILSMLKLAPPMWPTDRRAQLVRSRADPKQVKALRHRARAQARLAEDRTTLRAWQTRRLAQIYLGLLGNPR